MPLEEPIAGEWYLGVPCQHCGEMVLVLPDPSCGHGGMSFENSAIEGAMLHSRCVRGHLAEFRVTDLRRIQWRPPRNSTRMRRLILIAIALGIVLLWIVVPYGRQMADFQPVTFASAMVGLVREVWQDVGGLRAQYTILPFLFLGLLTPLYPSWIAALAVAAPLRLATRHRWKWVVEGIVVVLLSPVGWFVAYFYLLGWSASGPVFYPTLWLLPGFAALAGIVAMMIGIAPRSRIARIILQRRPTLGA